jgi:DNA-binding IclR family transcriptional regulator
MTNQVFPASAPRKPDFIQSLAKGLEILSAFTEGELLGNQQLSDLTGLPKATVSRLTSTLVDLGYLRMDAQSRKFTMGTRLIGMGVSVQRKVGLQKIARPYMEALSRDTDLTVSLGTRDRLDIVFLEVLRPQAQTRLVVNFDSGSLLPLPFTSIGLATIVAAAIKERALILEDLHKRYENDWPKIRTLVENAHVEYARLGYVSARRTWVRDVSGVGVPMQLAEGNQLFAFHCAGPSARMPLTYIQRELGPRLVQMVADIRLAMAQPSHTFLALPKQPPAL